MNVDFLVARKRREITQDDLAAQAGIAQADISRIEKAGWTPPPVIQEKLAAILETPVEQLFPRHAELAS